MDLLGKSMDWFLYVNGFRHERVKPSLIWNKACLSFGTKFAPQKGILGNKFRKLRSKAMDHSENISCH